MLRFFEKSFFCGCKSQISFIIETKMQGGGDRMGVAWRCSNCRDGSVGLGGHCVMCVEGGIILRGSWGRAPLELL